MPRTRSLVFLLSPASLGGIRGRALLEGRSSASFWEALRTGSGVPLGEIYAFISSLYFRGKRTYAQRFARPPGESGGVWVITPTRGLLREDARVTLADLREFAQGAIESDDPGYLAALRATAHRLRDELGVDPRVVLLGSIASARYLEPLAEVFGRQLAVPETFAGEELAYVPALDAIRHGVRPPKLERRR